MSYVSHQVNTRLAAYYLIPTDLPKITDCRDVYDFLGTLVYSIVFNDVASMPFVKPVLKNAFPIGSNVSRMRLKLQINNLFKYL